MNIQTAMYFPSPRFEYDQCRTSSKLYYIYSKQTEMCFVLKITVKRKVKPIFDISTIVIKYLNDAKVL